MRPELENELLLQVAAGTDPLTALAALPHEDEQVAAPAQPTHHSSGWIAVVLLVAIALLMLLR